MKKVYFLLTAAFVAATAMAGGKEMVAHVNHDVKASAVNLASQPVQLLKADYNGKSLQQYGMKKAAKATRAAGEYAFFCADPTIMAIGFSTNGWAYNATFGFASSNAPLVFYNYSIGGAAYEWTYSKLNDYVVENQQQIWNFSTSNAEDLVVPTVRPGEIYPPELEVTFNSGEKGNFFNENVVDYLCGGSGYYWMGEDDMGGEYGTTFYQNFGMESPAGQAFGYTYMNSYDVSDPENYTENGVYTRWDTMFKNSFGDITNLKIHNFTFVQPKPASMYSMSKGWTLLQVVANAPTQLLSYIYPINENGSLDDMPIAIGYASIKKGDNPLVTFEYYPLNEDGDEEEGYVFIDSAVAVTVEGFLENDAITSMSPASGYYPFSYEAYQASEYDLESPHTLYMLFSYDLNGETYGGLFSDNGLYYFDQRQTADRDEDSVTGMAYQTFTFDAMYSFIYAINGEDSVNIANAGGSVDVTINALYYDINYLLSEGAYTLTAPEWLDVTFGDSSQDTGLTTMTVSAAASEEGRTGIVTLEGMGATFKLEVIQGDGGNAVSVVAVDKNAEYYDLAGRRVANPEKGIYIKKAGNKAEKVLF